MIFLAKITEIIDELKFVIKFTSKGMIDNAVAYPINSYDQPELNEEILVYELETVFGYSYLYQKLRLSEDTRIKVKNSCIDVSNEKITITTNNGDISIDTDTGNLDINIKGDISITNTSTHDITINHTPYSIKLSDTGITMNGGALGGLLNVGAGSPTPPTGSFIDVMNKLSSTISSMSANLVTAIGATAPAVSGPNPAAITFETAIAPSLTSLSSSLTAGLSGANPTMIDPLVTH